MTLISELDTCVDENETAMSILKEGSLNEESVLRVLNRLLSLQVEAMDKNTFSAALLLTLNFKLYELPCGVDDELVRQLITDNNNNNSGAITNETADPRPNFKKLVEIEAISAAVLSRLLEAYSDKKLSEMLSKQFVEVFDTRSEALNFNDYFTKGFKTQSKQYTNTFLNLVKLIKFPDFNDHLIMLTIKQSLTLIESYDFNYRDKLLSVQLMNHMLTNTTRSELNMNNRALLLLGTLERYMYDKDSLRFVYDLYSTQLRLLDICESQYTVTEHDYKLHSKYVNNLFNSVLMCSNLSVKIVYFVILKRYLHQMGIYMVKYQSKLMDVLLVDTIDYMKANIHYKHNFVLIKLIFNLIELVCVQFHLRVHKHARQIINFLLKFIYYLCLDYSDDDEFDKSQLHERAFQDYVQIAYNDDVNEGTDKLYCLKYSFKILVNGLFGNETIRANEYDDFCALKSSSGNNNKLFKICIDFICKEIDCVINFH